MKIQALLLIYVIYILIELFLGVDSEEGFIKTKGWQQETSIRTLDLIRRFNQFPLAGFIFTDISKDGMMAGPNLKDTLEVASNTQLPVIASGGIASLEHINELSETGSIYGAITGKALYEKAFTLEEAIEVRDKRMTLAKRIIPCLDVDNGRVVKGVNFINIVDAGDPKSS